MRISHHSRDHGRHDDRHQGHGGHGHHFGPRGHGRHGFGRGGWHGHEEGEGPGGHRGGRRRRIFDSGELRLVLLKLIADQPRHGYELIRAIEELTGGSYVPSPGVVYPTLTLLQDVGEIEEAAAATGATSARKPFAITAQGTAELEAKKEEVTALLARLADLATQRERSDGGPVRRAMGNLRAVLINRLEREGVAAASLHDVADIIDEAARRIERLEDKH